MVVVVVPEVLVDIVLVAVVADAGHLSTLTIYWDGKLFTLPCCFARFCEEVQRVQCYHAHRGNRHHNATVLHLAEKTLTTYGPLYKLLGHKEAVDSNTNVLIFFLIG